MSFFASIYKGMTGLLGFSKALNNLSNNVANINTPGYKGTDLFFQALSSNYDGAGNSNRNYIDGGVGQGVEVNGNSVRYAQGDISSTGNENDLAIDGNGFFILLSGGNEFYTRNGQFRVDSDGYLIDPNSNYRVAGYVDNKLVAIKLDPLKASSAQATLSSILKGSLSGTAAIGTKYPGTSDQPITTTLYNSLGASTEISFSFTKTSADVWRVDFLDKNKSPIGASHEITFNALGIPLGDISTVTRSFEPYVYINDDNIDTSLTIKQSPVFPLPGDVTTASALSLSTSGAELITRSGNQISYLSSFEGKISADGYILTDDGKRLAARDSSGILQDVVIKDALQIPAVASVKAQFTGVLPGDDPVGTQVPPAGSLATQFSIYDSGGVLRTIDMRLEKTATNQWEIILTPENGAATRLAERLNFIAVTGVTDNTLRSDNQQVSASIDFGSGTAFTFTLDFAGETGITGLVERNQASIASSLSKIKVDGSPATRISSISIDAKGNLNYSYDNGTIVKGQQIAVVNRSNNVFSDISFDFSSLKIDQNSTVNTVSVDKTDGRSNGKILSYQFSDDGVITGIYSNGDRQEEGTIALAIFSNTRDIISTSKALFKAATNASPVYGKAKDGAFGTIRTQSIELSNVELSREFSEIIIVQRGFQASSQVLNATNEMIEELYSSTRGK